MRRFEILARDNGDKCGEGVLWGKHVTFWYGVEHPAQRTELLAGITDTTSDDRLYFYGASHPIRWIDADDEGTPKPEGAAVRDLERQLDFLVDRMRVASALLQGAASKATGPEAESLLLALKELGSLPVGATEASPMVWERSLAEPSGLMAAAVKSSPSDDNPNPECPEPECGFPVAMADGFTFFTLEALALYMRNKGVSALTMNETRVQELLRTE